MNIAKALNFAMLSLAIGMFTWHSPAYAGAQHFEWPFEVTDYSDCTDELVHWSATVYETLLINETPSGRVVIMDQWRFEGDVEGLSSGFIWDVRNGVSQYVERFGLDGNLTGGTLLIERAQLRSDSPDAPDIRLDVNIRFMFNAHGDLVVEDVVYTYSCMN